MSAMMDIFLSDRAFLSMLLSSIEVYKLECLGILLGFKTNKRVVVEYAIPFQAAERKFCEVTPNWRRELKVIEVLPKIVHLKKVGYFHSHPQYGKNRGMPKLSDKDKESMENSEIEIVVAINDAKKACSWEKTARGLSGTVGDYHIVMSGFYKRARDKTISRRKIVCPYAVGFDYALDE